MPRRKITRKILLRQGEGFSIPADYKEGLKNSLRVFQR
jgi:hypothetical protein